MGFTAFLCSKSKPFGHTNHYTKFSKSGVSGLTLCLMSTKAEAQTVKGLLAVTPADIHYHWPRLNLEWSSALPCPPW